MIKNLSPHLRTVLQASLAWLFLDEELSGKQLIGMALAAAGTLLVQVGNSKSNID